MNENQHHSREGFLRRTAREVRNYNRTMKILGAALGLLLVIVLILFVIAALYNQSGSFTVSVNKIEMSKYGLSLSEKSDMSNMTSHLNAKISESITNIAGETIPPNVDNIDGEHNGANYIAYTFYLQNRGEVAVPCEYTINISNISSGLDEAIRIKLFVNGEPTTYAKTSSNGTGPERGTKEFYSATVVAKERIDELQPAECVKFTVVIWIEGNDPDCVDALIGGKLKVDMDISIVY